MVRKATIRIYKRVLAAIYSISIAEVKSTSEVLAEQLFTSKKWMDRVCRDMEDEGLIIGSEAGWSLTEKGRVQIRVVMAGGVFDIIHPGHISTLTSSKKLGDVLVVSVARDKTVSAAKGHAPLNGEERRLELVKSLRCVDATLLGSERDLFETVVKVKPDIIALGYDQKHDEGMIRGEAEKRGVKVQVVRLGSPIPNLKSSIILKKTDVIGDF